MVRFNEWLGVKITHYVGSMWCAYVFAALALWSLPDNIDTAGHFVQWLSTTFLQLVLLSVIMVGQKQDGRAADTQAKETHDAVMEELSLLRQHIQEGT